MSPRRQLILDEDKIIIAIEKLWLVLDAAASFLWLVTGIVGCVLFYSQGYMLSLIGGAPSFITTCLVSGTLLFAISFYALILLLTSVALLFNLFSIARLVLVARLQTTPIPVLKRPLRLSIAYCLDSEGKESEAEKLYESVKDKRAFLRRFSPLCWGVAFDAFAEWLDSKGLLPDSENWPRAHQFSQIVRHGMLIVWFAAPMVLFQNIVLLLPGIAESYANPKIANYQGATNALAVFIWSQHVMQPDNRKVDDYKTELAEYMILSGDYTQAEAILKELIAECKRDPVGASRAREYVRRLSRLMDESGRADDAENLYKEAMGAGGAQSALELLLFAQFYMDRGDDITAKRLLDSGLTGHNVSPEEAAELNYQLGLLALKNAQFALAQTYCQRALDLIGTAPSPNQSQEPVYKLAWSEATYKRGDQMQALQPIDQLALKLDALPAKQQDGQVDLYLALAHSYDNIGREALAVRYMERSVAILTKLLSATNPARAESLIDLGEMYSKADALDQARQTLESALNLLLPIKNDPQMARCLLDLGAVSLKLKQQAQAQTYFARAIDQLTRTGIHRMPKSTIDQLSAYRDTLSRSDKNAENIDKIFAKKTNRFTQPSSKQG